MRVFILDEIMDLSNEAASINRIFDKIQTLSDNADYHLSHIVVDGFDVYDDYEEYISDQLRTIQEIKIELRTSKQQRDALILDASRYLTNAIPEVTVLANEFYRNPDPNSWLKLDQLFEGLQWFHQVALIYNPNKGNPLENSDLLTSAGAMRGTIDELAEALQSKDIILIADLLQFEIKRQFQDLLVVVGNIIDKEVVRYDLS
jgi:hypothetical protein